MSRKFRITIDKDLDPSINVNPNNGTIIILQKCSVGIYYFDTTSMDHNINKIQFTDYTVLNSADINKACFHQRKTKGADEAIIPQQIVRWPSTQTPKEAVRKNQIKNFPISIDDITRE